MAARYTASEREMKLIMIYTQQEIFGKIDTLDEDEDKIYKLVVLSDLYDQQIHDDMRLLHTMIRMYGRSMIEEFLSHNHLHLYPENDFSKASFGYDTKSEKLVFRTVMDSGLAVEVSTPICIKPVDTLDLRKIDIPGNIGPLNRIPQYASLTAKFCQMYDTWSTNFHLAYQDFLEDARNTPYFD